MYENLNNKIVDDLITNLFVGGLDAQEQKKLSDWISASEDNKAYFMRMQESWFSAVDSKTITRFNKDKAFQRFLIRKGSYKKKTQIQKYSVQLTFLRVAASIALILALGIAGYWLGAGKGDYYTKDHIVETPLGSQTKMYLPDGTLVWLNAGSVISYSRNFGNKNRVVNLEGEGYFEVTKNKHKPFYVKTNNLNVRVLGTKFNFRNFPDEEEAKVTLLEGRVSVEVPNTKTDGINLMPNQQVVYNKAEMTAKLLPVKSNNITVWTQGFIFFDEEKLPDIVKELERSYNVRITIADDSLSSYRFYGYFSRSEQSINDVLDVLVSTGKLKYEINGRDITLSLK